MSIRIMDRHTIITRVAMIKWVPILLLVKPRMLMSTVPTNNLKSVSILDDLILERLHHYRGHSDGVRANLSAGKAKGY